MVAFEVLHGLIEKNERIGNVNASAEKEPHICFSTDSIH